MSSGHELTDESQNTLGRATNGGRAAGPVLRLLVALVASAAVASVFPVGARAEDPRPHLQGPGSAVPAVGLGAPFADGVLTERRAIRLMASASAWSGGVYTAPTGETIRFYVSEWYRPDNAVDQNWVNYLASLYHSAEFSRLTVYVVPPFALATVCGAGAAACYSRTSQTMVVPGSGVGGWSVGQTFAHEYGHHLANNRINPPWTASDWGTKRWSSYVNLCVRAQQGTAFPGDTGANYRLDPAEGFAEAFRVTNELRFVSSTSWPIVDPSFYPDATARELIRLDAVQPWVGGLSTSTAGRFKSYGGRVQGFTSLGLMDGPITVTLTTRSGPNYEVQLVDKSTGGVIGTASTFRTGHATFNVTLCGQRSLAVRTYRRNGGTGTFSVAVTQ